MKTIELKKATAPLIDYVRHMGRGPVILTFRHKPVAALIIIKHADLEDIALSTNPKFIAMIERSRARQKAEGSISSEEMRKRLGIHTAKSRNHASKGS